MSATLTVDGKMRVRPRLAPCKVCGRPPDLSTGYVKADGTPWSLDGYGPFVLKCDHGNTDDESRGFYFVRSWNYDRAIALWQRGNGGKVRRRDLKRQHRRQRNARARARGWA
jgi:hypothetical protein